MAQSYEKAGVNLEAGYEVVRRIKKHVASTSRLGVMGNIGAFGGMFDLSALKVKEPVLVSGTDGVGTKLKLAFEMDKHDTIGIDAVAMCVNDVLAQGAEPLVFLDYVAVGRNEPQKIEAIVAGVADGCRQAGCALVGGETAEMPGMYAEGEYDIAGFTVGVVEKSQLIDGSKVRAGDVLVGVASSGVHSNGFSLVRKIVADNCLNLRESYPELSNKQLGEVLLTPTKIYVKQVLEVVRNCDVHGISHITGGGFDDSALDFIPSSAAPEQQRFDMPQRPEFTDALPLPGGYVAALLGGRFVVVDVRRARERILYEDYLRMLGNGSSVSQQLLFPERLVLSGDEYALLEENAVEFAALGFDIDFCGEGTVEVRGTPADMPADAVDRLLFDLLQAFATPVSLSDVRREKIAGVMARSGAKGAGRTLSREEAAALLAQLADTGSFSFSPSGKAITAEITPEDLRAKLG